MSFQLLHVDDHLLVLNKPSGLLAVPGRGADKQDCLSARVQVHYPDARIVHRLDMDTSGLLLMARGAEMQRQLSLAFANRRIGKRYTAVVAGQVTPPDNPDGWGLIDLPLLVDWPNRPRSRVDPVWGKPSRTRWRPAPAQSSSHSQPPPLPTTRLELEPITGRSHQLRVHLHALGHPILGDPLYAPADIRNAAPRLLLHASRLSFTHPITGADLCFACPPDF